MPQSLPENKRPPGWWQRVLDGLVAALRRAHRRPRVQEAPTDEDRDREAVPPLPPGVETRRKLRKAHAVTRSREARARRTAARKAGVFGMHRRAGVRGNR